MIITIDGPSASGKSSVGRLLAEKLNCYYIYSGLLYRALGYLLIEKKGYSLNELATAKEADVSNFLDPKRFVYRYDPENKEQVLFDGVDITQNLKVSYIDQASSIVSLNPLVRSKLTQLQHHIASQSDVVIDGRDAGSVVFPDAEIKFFLTASLEVRAARWQRQQKARGREYTLQQAQDIISSRDARDSERALAPLMMPKDAIKIDNSDITQDQTLAIMLGYISKKMST